MAAIFGFDDVGNHANMLLDLRRVQAFAQAIAKVVRPGDVVVDVGAGSGVLSVLAAKAGARRVYAIERGALARLILPIARDNGVADKITLLRTDARTATFDEPPTVIVSETLGSFGVDEDTLALVKLVKTRCAPDVRVLPARFSVHLTLAHLPALDDELRTIATGTPVELRVLRDLLVQRPTLAWVAGGELLSTSTSEPFELGVSSLPKVFGGAVRVRGTRGRVANAVIGSFSTELCEGVSFVSAPDRPVPSWQNIVFPLDPALQVDDDEEVQLEARPRLLTDRGTWSWQVRGRHGTRVGDSMKALVGDKDDLLKQLGLKTGDDLPTAALAAFRDALAGGPADVDTMTTRVLAAQPERFADRADAEQVVRHLLRAADALD